MVSFPLASAFSMIFIAAIVVLIVGAFIVRARRHGVKEALKKKGPPMAQ